MSLLRSPERNVDGSLRSDYGACIPPLRKEFFGQLCDEATTPVEGAKDVVPNVCVTVEGNSTARPRRRGDRIGWLCCGAHVRFWHKADIPRCPLAQRLTFSADTELPCLPVCSFW